MITKPFPKKTIRCACVLLFCLLPLLRWTSKPQHALESPQPRSHSVSDPQQLQTGEQKSVEVFTETSDNVSTLADPVASSSLPLRGLNQRRVYARPTQKVVSAHLWEREPLPISVVSADAYIRVPEEEMEPNTLRAIRVPLNVDAFEDVYSGNRGVLLLPHPDGISLRFEVRNLRVRTPNTYTLEGVLQEESEESVVQMVVHDGVVHGGISRYVHDQHLEYRVTEAGELLVRELDNAAMTDECELCMHPDAHDVHTLAAERALEGEAEEEVYFKHERTNVVVADTPGYTTVDLVVGYGREAREADGGVSQIEARILSAVDRLNLTLSNSEISQAEVMLLGTVEDPDYDYPGNDANSLVGDGQNPDEYFHLLDPNDGMLDSITDYGSELGADFMCFVIRRPHGGAAGIAQLGGRHSIVARDYMTTNRLTFAHELGHNFGCFHSWGDSEQSYFNKYGWRLILDTGVRVRTVMAYGWDWGQGSRIPHFANPDVSYLGSRTGQVDGYNAIGDPLSDPRYIVGGAGGYDGHDPNRSGFDGTNPGLGARNAHVVRGDFSASEGIPHASGHATRTPLAVVDPSVGVIWARGSTQRIFWYGGDHSDTATLDLYRDGGFDRQIATGVSGEQRRFAWTLPVDVAVGTGYQIRVTLGDGTFADSGLFTVAGEGAWILAHTPPEGTLQYDPASQLSVTFTESMDTGSFSLVEDIVSFTGPGGADLTSSFSGSSWSQDDTVLTLLFSPQSVDGDYELVLGPMIQNARGGNMDQDMDGLLGEAVEDRYTARYSLDINTPPSDIQLSESQLLENQATGTTVGTFSTTDVDGGMFQYALVSGSGDADNGSFLIEDDRLIANESFDREQQPSRSIRIRSTDHALDVIEEVFVITILNVDEPPLIQRVRPMNPAARIPSDVGMLLETTVTDVDSTPSVIWRKISGPGNVAFGSPDQAETSALFSEEGSYVLELEVADALTTVTETFTIETGVVPGGDPGGAGGAQNGLLARWSMNQESGSTVLDQSGNGQTGTFERNASWGAGKFMGGVLFSDTADTILIAPFDEMEGLEELSISLWFRVDDLTRDHALFSKFHYTDVNTGVWIFRDEATESSGRSDTVVARFGGVVIEADDGAVNDTQWHHLALTFEGGSSTGLRLYVDGQEVSDGPADVSGLLTSPSSSEGVRLGNLIYNFAVFALEGAMDETRVYNRVLTPAEIATLASDSSPNVGPQVSPGVLTSVEPGGSATTNATVTDEGQPFGTLTSEWNQVSGPSPAVFANALQPVTDVTASTAGSYVLRLSGDDGAIRTFADLSWLVRLFAPTDLVSWTVAAGRIELTWTDHSEQETGYRVERALAPSGPWVPIHTTASNVEAYHDTEVGSAVYLYRVIATTAASESTPSNVSQSSTLDTDADGMLDDHEAVAGTHPADGSSVFELSIQLPNATPGIEFSVPSVSGRYYRVYARDSLLNGDWEVLPGYGNVPGTGAALEIMDTGATQRFYKIEVQAASWEE